jgi:para-nitrobenzyl esterase
MVESLKDKISGLAGGIKDAIDRRNTANKQQENGAVHSADIEYAMGNLPSNRVFDWQPEDYEVSAIFQSYYANFIKTCDPNGLGLPQWNEINNEIIAPVLHIDVETEMKTNQPLEKRYQFLDEAFSDL